MCLCWVGWKKWIQGWGEASVYCTPPARSWTPLCTRRRYKYDRNTNTNITEIKLGTQVKTSKIKVYIYNYLILFAPKINIVSEIQSASSSSWGHVFILQNKGQIKNIEIQIQHDTHTKKNKHVHSLYKHPVTLWLHLLWQGDRQQAWTPPSPLFTCFQTFLLIMFLCISCISKLKKNSMIFLLAIEVFIWPPLAE